jgi:hypothetical protein
MVFLTYNDLPSGIYSSQVIDVCRFLNNELKAEVKLISLVSVRRYFSVKRKIKSEFPTSIVLPMFPGVQNWRYNKLTLYFLFFFIGKQSVIARGPFAACLALGLRKSKMVYKVCFDARGAYDAEFNEYDVASNSTMNDEVFKIEKSATLGADFRIAVSHKLILYWKEKFGYDQNKHVVIPCTLSASCLMKIGDQTYFDEQRQLLGYSNRDIVFVYAGSSAGWQSLKRVDDFLCYQMDRNPDAKALLLTKNIPSNMNVIKHYKDRVEIKWIEEEQVLDILHCCDFGLLIREKSVTNTVASPVKFAEYVAAGLKVIISEDIGDYSDFVVKNSCGYDLNHFQKENIFTRPTQEEKQHNMNVAKKYFSKAHYFAEYANMLNSL